MDLRKCKSQLLASLLSLSLSISAIFLFAGCSKETAKTSPSASTEESMTRQAFYSLLYKEITQDELLRSIYFPETTQLDAAKILCNISGEREFSEESQAELVYNAKLKSVSNLRIATKTLKQNDCNNLSLWTWQPNGDKYSPWSGLIADFDMISDENKEAVVFFCEAGLANLAENQEDYSVFLHPDEIVSEKEATQMREKIKKRQIGAPLCAILSHDHEGNDIYLRFSDSVSYFLFKNMTEYLTVAGEVLNSFVYFDETGAELSLWISTASGGMFSVPLNIARGSICHFPCQYNSALLSQRLDVIKAMLPFSVKSKASSDFETILSARDSNEDLIYECKGANDFKITISCVFAENSISSLYFKVN